MDLGFFRGGGGGGDDQKKFQNFVSFLLGRAN